MDMVDASAMTEASGLENDPASGKTASTIEAAPNAIGESIEQKGTRLSDELRRLTVAAPLRSLFMAFLFGLLVARRRRG